MSDLMSSADQTNATNLVEIQAPIQMEQSLTDGKSSETDWSVYHRKLFVGGIAFSTTTETLRKYFSTWGILEDCIIMMDKYSKPPRSRGFGFITYQAIESVERVMEKYDHVLDGRPIYLVRATPHQLDLSPPKVIPNKVYFSEILEETKDSEMKEVLETFGPTSEVFILKDHVSGESRKFGFGSFINTDDATKAIEAGAVTLKDGVTIAKITKATAQEDTRRHRGYPGRGSYRGRGGRFDHGRGGYEGDDYYRYGSSYGGRGYGRRGYPVRYAGGRAGGAGGRLYYSGSGRNSEGGYHYGSNHGSQYNSRGGNNQYVPWYVGGYGGGERGGGGRRQFEARNKSFNPY